MMKHAGSGEKLFSLFIVSGYLAQSEEGVFFIISRQMFNCQVFGNLAPCYPFYLADWLSRYQIV